MQLMKLISSAMLLCSAAMAKDATVHIVQVGLDSMHTFSPNSLTAEAGDIIEFEFLTGNHSVVQSSYSSPCESIAAIETNVTGFSSGFMPVNSSMSVFSLTVNSTAPIWAYCSQVGHCAQGMVFAVNAPKNGSKTFKSYMSRALASANTTYTTHSTNATHSTNTTASTAKTTAITSSNNTRAAASSSGVANAATTTTATKSPPVEAKGARSFVNTIMLLLLALVGFFFMGL